MAMKFSESQLLKDRKVMLGNKRDGRKKFIKSTTPTSDLKKSTITKKQEGGNIFTTYNSLVPYEGPTFDLPEINVASTELPINRLESNRRNVVDKIESIEAAPSSEPLPTSIVGESKYSAPKVSANPSKSEFINTMTSAFENALKSKGLDTKYTKYLVAQSALESNWGKSQSGKNNFGGIKGKGTTRRTREVINGKDVFINDSFRDFKDVNDYANYHVGLLNNKRYNAFQGDFIDSVVKGGYATDPRYKQVLSGVYNQIAKAQQGFKFGELINKAQSYIKNTLPKEEPSEPINTADVVKEYGPSVATSFLTGNVNPFISKLFESSINEAYTHKFGTTNNKFKEFADVMSPIFKEVLEENNFPTTNLNNIVRQAALESDYGLNPRGALGYNLSGIKHPGNSIAPKYRKTKHTDKENYMDFDNLKEFASYKVKLLNNKYKALEATNTDDFINRLHGNNPSKANYSDSKGRYHEILNTTYSLNKYLK